MTKSKFLIMFGFVFISIFLLKDLEYLKPLFFYITSIHELCHGLMAVLTGGSIKEFDLYSSGGHTISGGGMPILISLAGYIGTTFIGALLIYLSDKKILLRIFLLIFSICVIISYFLYIKSFFSMFFLSTLIISGLIIYLSLTKFVHYVGLILGSVFIIDSFSDAKVYLFSKILGQSDIIYKTDAGILARYLGLEFLALPIALSIFLINMFILYYLFKAILKRP